MSITRDLVIIHDFLIERGGGERFIIFVDKAIKNTRTISAYYIPEMTYREFESLKIYALDKFLSKLAYKNSFFKILLSIIFFRFIVPNIIKRNFKENTILLFSGFYSIFSACGIRNMPKTYYLHQESLLNVFTRSSFKGTFWKFIKTLSYPILYFTKKVVNNCFDCVIANSEYIKKTYLNSGMKANMVLYPPVDLGKFGNIKPKKGKYFLYFGRLYKHKRIDVILKVFSRIRNEKLIVVGDGPLRNLVEAYSKRHDNITYLGFVSDKRLIELILNCKAVIYITEKEPFGMVPVEANACGKPVIVSNEGGVKEIVKNKFVGLVIKPPYEKSLERVIRNFNKFKFSVSKCRSNANRFSYDVFKKKIMSILNKCIKKHKSKYVTRRDNI
ncbi:MAG: glycosyltransferase [Candidatus Aenigmarchaeota archaeon]|nr:glycosyltransferase [Candidatus Aenigmarchaeota archaeon]